MLNPEEVEKIKAAYAQTGNVQAVAKELDIPYSTVSDYINGRTKTARNVPAEVEAARVQRRVEFVNRAWDNISKASTLLGLKLDAALDAEAEGEKTEIDLRELTTVIGTLYDKTALAEGEPTERTEITAADRELMAGVERIYRRLKGGDDDERIDG